MIRVYLAVNPLYKAQKTLCEKRNEEILKVKNQKVYTEKLQVWLLLEHALKDCGFDLKKLNFEKLPSGKWIADGVEFSLSHSKGVFAVAISDEPVGVDVQKHTLINHARLAQKILSTEELKEYENLSSKDKNEHIIKKWTEKESLFKAYEKGDLKYCQLSNLNYLTQVKDFEFLGEKYSISVSSKTDKKVEFVIVKYFD